MNAYIVADQRWAFGRNGGVLFSLPADLEHFHSLTRNGTVIMGPERLKFYTGGQPLPQRRNIIVTRDLSALPEGVEGVASPEEALSLAGGPEQEDLWIIGGGSIYAALLDRCRRVHLTRVETRVEESDTFFPNLDKLPNWEAVSSGEMMEEDGLKFHFIEYVNKKISS